MRSPPDLGCARRVVGRHSTPLRSGTHPVSEEIVRKGRSWSRSSTLRPATSTS
jgi:hypothetical protein